MEVERVGAHALVIAAATDADVVRVVRVEAGRVLGERPGSFGLPGKQTHLYYSSSLLLLSLAVSHRCLLRLPLAIV